MGILKTEAADVSVIVVPFTAQGHINSLLHLSRLLASYNLPINFISTMVHSRQAKLRVHGWDPLASSNVIFHEIQVPHFPSPPPNPNSSSKFPIHLLPSFHSLSHLRQPFFNLLSTLSMSSKRVIVIYDHLMGSVVQDVPSVPNAEAFMFVACSAFSTFFVCWEISGRNPDIDIDKEVLKEITLLENCCPKEFIEFMESQETPSMKISGILYNTCKLIEGEYPTKLTELEGRNTSVYAIGPFNPVKMITTSNGQKHKCLDWLDKQEPNSVIYISFGTSTTLGEEQIHEMAVGLEASGMKFLWALKDADRGDIFNGEEEMRRTDILAQGFEERMKGKGVVERDWVPQMEILAHPSTGGFLSHCGWNSCLDSITAGVPIAAWPMHSDQPSNAVLIAKVLKIGIIVRDWGTRHELVTSFKIEQAIRTLMISKQGDNMRMRAVELGGNVRQLMAEGSVTTLELDSFIAHIVR